MRQKDFLTPEPRKMNYRVFYPSNYKAKLPLIVYLHGAGERGKNLEHITRHGLARLLDEGMEIEAVVLCPQCPADCVWDNLPHQVKDLIDKIRYLIELSKELPFYFIVRLDNYIVNDHYFYDSFSYILTLDNSSIDVLKMFGFSHSTGLKIGEEGLIKQLDIVMRAAVGGLTEEERKKIEQ